MIEGTTQTRIDIMNLPEHSKKSCTGNIRKKVLKNFQEKKSTEVGALFLLVS